MERRTAQYTKQANKGRKQVNFEPGDWVWLHFQKERFPRQRRSKLLPQGDEPFQIVEKINDNAYRLDLPGEYEVSATFNVTDLTPFDAECADLRANPFQEEEDDMDPETSQRTTATCTTKVPFGPLTRTKVKQMREWVNGLVKDACAEGEVAAMARVKQDLLRDINLVAVSSKALEK